MNKYTELLERLATAPASQIDPPICVRLRQLANQDEVKSDELLDILDDCAFSALASDGAMGLMNFVWTKMLEDEGLTQGQAHTAAKERRSKK